MEEKKIYEIDYNGIEVEVERLPNGKFRKPPIAHFCKQGTGCCWLDDGKIPYGETEEPSVGGRHNVEGRRIGTGSAEYGYKSMDDAVVDPRGRFAPNLLVSDNVLDDGCIRKSDGGKTTRPKDEKAGKWGYDDFQMGGYGDEGDYSMFFSLDRWWEKLIDQLPDSIQRTFPFLIVPKPSRSEKEKGLENFEREGSCVTEQIAETRNRDYYSHNLFCVECGKRKDYNCGCNVGYEAKEQEGRKKKVKNTHISVKPIKLMSYLITIGSRLGDVVLDPFIGSGTTAIAAHRLGRKYIGFESEIGENTNDGYGAFEIAEARLESEGHNVLDF